MTSAVLLDVSGFSAGYGDKKVVVGADFKVHEGEVAIVLGSNGAGKTTLLQGLYGALDNHSGNVTFAGRDISGHVPADNITVGLGYVPQGGVVFPDLSVEENLAVCLPRGVSASRRFPEMYELFPSLEQRRAQRARSLSGGEKQMLALAMGLIPSPRLLLVDEPSIGLSPALQEQTFHKLQEINKSGGTSLVIVEQAVDRAFGIADFVYVMHAGHLSAVGNAAEVDIESVAASAASLGEDK